MTKINQKLSKKEFSMELVYLWVEDYKNIKKQGFNFSPNFDVKFTPIYEDEELSDKSELKITLKENPLKDFFELQPLEFSLAAANSYYRKKDFGMVLKFGHLIDKVLFSNFSFFRNSLTINLISIHIA